MLARKETRSPKLTPIVLTMLICEARTDSGKSSPIVLEIIYPQSPPGRTLVKSGMDKGNIAHLESRMYRSPVTSSTCYKPWHTA